MNSPIISVIVPVYKVEKYVAACIESILSQSFTDFELILVDDGSPDNSGAICDEYASKDNRIRVFHKENGGVTSARKYGIEQVRGEWINFIDSDDTIPQDAFDYLYNKVVEYNLDIAIGAVQIILLDGKVIVKDNKVRGIFNRDEYIKILLRRECDFGPCCKLYNIKLFYGYPYGIEKTITQFEDFYTNVGIALNASKIGVENYVVYHYIKRENSASSKIMAPDLWLKLVLCVRKLLENSGMVYHYYKELNNFIFDILLYQVFLQRRKIDKQQAKSCVDYNGRYLFSLKDKLLIICINSSLVRFLYVNIFAIKVRICSLLKY